VMTDLNTLVTPDYDGTLTTANDINNSGRMTGQALEHETGMLVAFVARP
jgi:hypothetical protein